MKRNYLVFVRAGAKTLHHSWMNQAGENRLWDLQISQYDDDPSIGSNGDLPLSQDKGTKWDSVYRYLKNHPEVLDNYRYILFADDDIKINCQQLNRFFEICDEHDLLVAQPSLHPNSYFCYSILLRCPLTRLRYTNYVECMAPALRTDYLREHVLENMAGAKSGWGLDLVWTLWMDNPEYRSAIVDEVSMEHTRPHATGSKGSIYAALDGKDGPQRELEHFMARFRGIPTRMLTYGAVLPNGMAIGGTMARVLTGVSLITSSVHHRERKRSFRTALGLFVRVVTAAGYTPKKVFPV